MPVLKAEIERAPDGTLHPVVVHCLGQLSGDARKRIDGMDTIIGKGKPPFIEIQPIAGAPIRHWAW